MHGGIKSQIGLKRLSTHALEARKRLHPGESLLSPSAGRLGPETVLGSHSGKELILAFAFVPLIVYSPHSDWKNIILFKTRLICQKQKYKINIWRFSIGQM